LKPLPLFFASLAAALPLAMLSWHFVEHPALKMKWRLPSTQPA